MRDLHCKVRAQVIELSSYNVTLVDGKGVWEVMTSVREVAAARVHEEPMGRTWNHEDITLESARRSPPIASIAAKKVVRVYFDGGCKKHLGSCGAVAFAPGGECLAAEARYLGKDADTNNKAEARGLVLALELASRLVWKPTYDGLLVLGDSKLMISFM